MKIARSNSVRPTKFLGLPRRRFALAFSMAFSLGFAFAISLLSVTVATAEPNIESATAGTETKVESSIYFDSSSGVFDSSSGAFDLAQAGGDAGRSRPLEPRYQPREPEPKSWYNGSYVFALTRSVADSTIAPAGQVPLYVLTVPLDIAFLPFALIGGLFG